MSSLRASTPPGDGNNAAAAASAGSKGPGERTRTGKKQIRRDGGCSVISHELKDKFNLQV